MNERTRGGTQTAQTQVGRNHNRCAKYVIPHVAVRVHAHVLYVLGDVSRVSKLGYVCSSTSHIHITYYTPNHTHHEHAPPLG